ncbi:MAG: YeeE/YedE family protein [Dehalococcoidia bacterium]|nr:YeeE/YedE family protein [Dehalococcoidia bacterium]
MENEKPNLLVKLLRVVKALFSKETAKRLLGWIKKALSIETYKRLFRWLRTVFSKQSLSKLLGWLKHTFSKERIYRWLSWRPKITLSGNLALITGIVMGVSAAVLQGYFNLQPPVAEGICAISHPSELVSWVQDKLFGTGYVVNDVFRIVPVLTPIGFILGSFIAAKRNKEFKFRRGPVRDNLQAFALGFIVIVFAMLWGSCPIRTAILASYGETLAILLMGVLVLGVVTACLYIKWKVRRAR